jgi:hypothetical protein
MGADNVGQELDLVKGLTVLEQVEIVILIAIHRRVFAQTEVNRFHLKDLEVLSVLTRGLVLERLAHLTLVRDHVV